MFCRNLVRLRVGRVRVRVRVRVRQIGVVDEVVTVRVGVRVGIEKCEIR